MIDTLAVSAQGFRRGANRVRKQMWWKDMKMRLCLIGGVIILLVIIIGKDPYPHNFTFYDFNLPFPSLPLSGIAPLPASVPSSVCGMWLTNPVPIVVKKT